VSDETKTEGETTEAKKELFKPTENPATPKAPPGVLTRGTDLAARPGFRSPANTKSKAQKKKK
jgi:hypothetical protein